MMLFVGKHGGVVKIYVMGSVIGVLKLYSMESVPNMYLIEDALSWYRHKTQFFTKSFNFEMVSKVKYRAPRRQNLNH